ncbi:hypothetical protein [Streptomyces sp. CAI-85]|uniref:hypothetical protein n=1 Tax=Streptomyces sp. CAI-85 TaxID=1472662 RepID=UPI0015875867|nr:hypothetical protein [Streptomyces sp. CAI-85]NUV58807.1 hypothetical protein [Streptomyces sp. CAI-85]
MAWTDDHKVKIIVGVLGALAVIAAAVITGLMKSDSTTVDQKTGGDGTVCVQASC